MKTNKIGWIVGGVLVAFVANAHSECRDKNFENFATFIEVLADKAHDCKIELKVYGRMDKTPPSGRCSMYEDKMMKFKANNEMFNHACNTDKKRTKIMVNYHDRHFVDNFLNNLTALERDMSYIRQSR